MASRAHMASKPLSIRHVPTIVKQKRMNIRCDLISTLNHFASSQSVHLASQSIITFTLLYTTTNWYYYRRIRKDIETHKAENNHKDENEEE